MYCKSLKSTKIGGSSTAPKESQYAEYPNRTISDCSILEFIITQ